MLSSACARAGPPPPSAAASLPWGSWGAEGAARARFLPKGRGRLWHLPAHSFALIPCPPECLDAHSSGTGRPQRHGQVAVTFPEQDRHPWTPSMGWARAIRGLALLGELWHPVGAAGEASPPPGAVSPPAHGWAPREGVRGSHVTRALTSPPPCPGSQSSSWCLPTSLQSVSWPELGLRGFAPQPPFSPQLGLPGHRWAGEGQAMLEGLSPPLTGPLTPRPILELPGPGSVGAPVPALPCVPSQEGSRGPVLLQDSTAQTPVGQGPPAPRWGFPKASSQGPAQGCGCFSPGCAGVWGSSAGSARAGLG